MSAIIAPPAPSSPCYVGKILCFGDNTQIQIFGYPLPNSLSSLVSGKPSPWSILQQTTLFNVSSLTDNQEVIVVLCDRTITRGSTINVKWYRDRDNLNVFTLTETVSSDCLGCAAWIGWLSNRIAKSFGVEEIRENGNYHVDITVSGVTNFSYTIDFAVTGMPARLDVSRSGFNLDYRINLSDYFDTSNYIRAGICSQPFTNGQSSAPSGILHYVNAPSSNSGAGFDASITDYGYNIYGFAQAVNGLYYTVEPFIYPPAPPTLDTSQGVGGRGEGSLYVGWSESPTPNISTYRLKRRKIGGISSTIATGARKWTITGLDYGTSYALSVAASDGYDFSNYSEENIATTTAKSPGNLTCPAYTQDTIDIRVADGMTGNWDYIRVYAYDNNIFPTYKDITKAQYTSGIRVVTWTNLTAGVTYKFNAHTKYTYNNTDLSSVYWSNDLYVTTSARPQNFAWDIPKVSGGAWPTAAEWNGLTARINEFRSYKGLSAYSFTTGYSGNPLTAAMFNQARNAIADMSTTGLPGVKNAGEMLYASDLNALVSCLNAIT